MKVVQIISGGYGFRAKAGAPTKLILAGEVVCVDDAEAERLVKLGVAAEAELDAETKAIVEQADADSNDVETQEEASEAEEKPGRKGRKTAAEQAGITMTDFLEMAMADIDDVFFQEFVEQHTIDGETFDVVPYETGLKERKSHWEAGAKQNFDQGLYISQKQFFIRAADYGPAPKIGKPMEYDRISYTIKSCQNEHGLYLVTLERVRQ